MAETSQQLQLTRKFKKKPFSWQVLLRKKVFNHRHFRARHTVENAFGILATRWCIFLQPIFADPENAVHQGCPVLAQLLASDGVLGCIAHQGFAIKKRQMAPVSGETSVALASSRLGSRAGADTASLPQRRRTSSRSSL